MGLLGFVEKVVWDTNLVPRAFPSKNGWPHPFFKGKALGTRLLGYSHEPPGVLLITPYTRRPRPKGFLSQAAGI